MMRLALLTLAFVVAACGGDDEPSTGGRLRAADASAPRDAGADSATSQEEEDTGAQPDAGSPPDDPEEPEESGEATYYNAEGVGACGIQTPPDYLVAAINGEQYSKANCGRCVSVTGPKGTVVRAHHRQVPRLRFGRSRSQRDGLHEDRRQERWPREDPLALRRLSVLTGRSRDSRSIGGEPRRSAEAAGRREVRVTCGLPCALRARSRLPEGWRRRWARSPSARRGPAGGPRGPCTSRVRGCPNRATA